MTIPRFVLRLALRLALALALVAAGAAGAAAQGEPEMAQCTVTDIDLEPCLAPYDVAPVMIADSVPAAAGRRPRTARVWMLVDETGTVRATQVAQSSGGADGDLAAVARARALRFVPAMHRGSPTPVWIVLPVTAVPPPQTCADISMGAPLSAGVATFVDSTVFPTPELGTAYHYRGMSGFPMDLFVYADGGQGDAAAQVDEAVRTLREGDVDGAPDSLAVMRRGRERVRLYASGGGGVATGESALLRVWFGGERGESYAAVFPVRNGFVKIRATYPLHLYGREITAEFVRQIMTDRAWRESGCRED